MTIDRRTEIQKILDKSQPGWVAVKPDKGDPYIYVLQNSSEGLEVRLNLPRMWFDDGEWGQIKAGIRRAIEAKLKQTKD